MTVLDRFGQQIAHAYRGSLVCLIAGRPDALSHMKSSMRGGNHLKVGDRAWWYETTARGIELREPPVTVYTLTYAALTSHIDTLTPAVIALAREACRLHHTVGGGRPGDLSAIDAAFPLALDDHPADLLEFLEAMT